MRSLRIIDRLVDLAEVGAYPDHKALVTLRAQLVYDLGPLLNELDWPVLRGASAFAPLEEEVE